MKSKSLNALRLAMLVACLGGFALSANADTPHPGPDHPGAKIYQKLCVDCHAENGEGVDGKADDPLYGNRDIPSLAGRIERTMPEDHEDLCVGEDARAVAEYIYDAFYSVEARARNTPARIDLTRLTVPQYRNSLADLIGNFRGGYGNPVPKERGLNAHYYGSRNHSAKKENNGKDKFEQVDSTLRFDFGEGTPKLPEGKEFPKEEFSIRWDGMILTEETGDYEFVIRTRNGVMLWVNEREDQESKTIDGWVAPNNEKREISGKTFLLGRRAYPIRLDFFKYKEKAAAVELLWKPPHGTLEPVPTRNLVPGWCHESFVVSTPFPADDRSVGYERGTAVSRAWLDAVTAGAIEAADYVGDHLDQLAGTKQDDPKREEKIRNFARRFTEIAFRRPLSAEEQAHFVDQRFEQGKSTEQRIRRLVLLTLTSPRFLYPGYSPSEEVDDFDVASRLALALWDSLPDQRLFEQARKGELSQPQQIESTARRMLDDARSRAKMRGFFHHWLELDRANDLDKDSKVFSEFNETVLADLRSSLFLFLDDIVWSEKSDYR
ncbi:MAG: DUF1592 domain-containing protein, partial [Verrucomicrobiae bacterium]|nr:DUF1592 domain-containing protein [Verrucomicrobiae bacterium]